MKQKIQVLLIIYTSFFLNIFPSYSHEIKKEEVEKIVKNYLIKNPELIQSTLDDYKKTIEINKKKMQLDYYMTSRILVFLMKTLI